METSERTKDRVQVVLGILNLLWGALGLLAFAFGGPAWYLCTVGNLVVAYVLLKDFDFGG